MNKITLIKKEDIDLHLVLHDYFKSLIREGVADTTIENHRSLSKLFMSWYSGYGQRQPSEQLFDDYVDYLFSRNNKFSHQKLRKSSIKKHIHFLKKFSRFLYDRHMTVDDFAQSLKAPRPSYRIIQAFSGNQIDLIFHEIASVQTTEREKRVKISLCYLLLDTGLRISEAVSLSPMNIDFERRLITVVGKGDKQREVPFSREMSVLFRRVIRMNHPSRSECIWKTSEKGRYLSACSFRAFLRLIGDRIGEKSGMDTVRLSPHTFRHTFAKNWIMQGHDALSLRRILGHSSMEMTMRYVNMWGDDLVAKHDQYTAPGTKIIEKYI